ncbi:MAG: cache domain-containing protein [Desulfarculus sp.]|nr:cache domain-containing protein [Desulfarculus sp.]
MRRTIMLAALCLIAFSATTAPAQDDQAAAQMTVLREQVQARLDHLDRGVARAAQGLAQAGLTGPAARQVLHELLLACPEAIDVAAVDSAGRMVTMEPAAYRHLEGTDISRQEHMARLLATRGPVMSQVFRTVEKVDAVDLEQPVLGPEGRMVGSVSLLYRPDALLAEVIKGLAAGQGQAPEVWAMDLEGRIIYDQDPQEVDRNLFSDPLYQDYPELVALGRRIQAQGAGQGGYSFLAQGSDKAVNKQCLWDSIGLHGTWWRLVLTRVVR